MPHLLLSKRASQTPPSPIRRLAQMARQAEERGTKVFRLNIGQPDIPSPKEFFEEYQRHTSGVLAYEVSEGNAALRTSWARVVGEASGSPVEPDHFLITVGASEALVFVMMVCCDPGDEVLIFDPTYANYIGFAAISGVNLVPVPCQLQDEFALPPRDVIEAQISSRTRAILLCNPNNPTGTVYTDAELEMLIDISKEWNLFLVVDETYREFVYDGRKPRCIFSLTEDRERLVVVDSLSKRFSLCGARIGCLITFNKELRKAAFHIAQARLAAPTIEQYAATCALDKAMPFVGRMVAEFAKRRDAIYGELTKLEGVSSFKPHGAFYTIVKLPVRDAEHFATFMLNDFSFDGATAFIAPAAGFYMRRGVAKNEARIAFVLNSSDLTGAVQVLGEGLKAYPGS